MSQTGNKVPNVKVALCFSGQPRTWRSCKDTWENIGLYHKNIDVFCHIWDHNTVPNDTTNIKVNTPVNAEEIQELLDFLKPKAHIIDSEKQFTPYDPNQAITHPPYLSQYYGVLKAARLKKQYEIVNDFKYDIVVRVRFDSYFPEVIVHDYNQIKKDTLHGFMFNWDVGMARGRVSDIFWFARSEIYDMVADYYLNVSKIDKKWFQQPSTIDFNYYPETVFFHYIKKYNLNINPHNWNVKLYRESIEQSIAKKEGGYEIW